MSSERGCFNWIHFGNWMMPAAHRGGSPPVRWRALREDLAKLHDNSGPWDAVFITGDIATTGADREYDIVNSQLGEFMEGLRTLGSVPVVLTVPGNHDIAKPPGRLSFKLTPFLWDMDELRQALWSSDGDEHGVRMVVREAFRAFDQWSEGTAPFRPQTYQSGGLPGDFTATIPLGRKKIGIAGLNTAFLQLTDGYDFDFRERIAVDPQQLERACDGDPDRWAKAHDVCLLLTHHPASWLSPESRLAFYEEMAPPGRFAIQLCSNASTKNTECAQDGPVLVIQSPPFTDHNMLSGYTVGSLRLTSGPEALTILPRRFVEGKRGTFVADPLATTLALSTFQRIFQPVKQPKSRAAHSSRAQARPSAPVRVEFLELQNFRSFERITLDFDQSSRMPGTWTCLAGINGAGKSSILQALALVLLGEPYCRELGGDRLKRYRRLAHGKREGAQIRAWIRKDGRRRYVEVGIGEKETNSSRVGSVYLQGVFDFWKEMRSQVVLAYGATRNLSDFLDTRYASLTPDVRRLMTLFDPLTQIASAEFLLGKQSSRQKSLVPLFDALLREVFGESLRMQFENGQAAFTTSGEPVEALDLPDGFRSTIAWLVDLCSCWCEKSPKIAAEGRPQDIEAIVLIDEIDLHLHPSLQRTIVPQLRKALPRVQWIVTTHSPLVLSSFDTAEIVALDKSEPGGVRYLDRQILGFTTDQVYEWLMETQPTSAALEQELANPERKMSVSDEELAEMMVVSPEINAKEARKRSAKRRERLKRLKP